MVFSSLTFLCCALPVALLIYYTLPRMLKNSWLLLFSLVFYAWGEPVYVLLMLASVAINWGAALLISRHAHHKKPLLALAVFVNIALLVVFKYSALLVSTANALTGLHLPVPQIALPIGISFFTFQALSYVIDVYRAHVPAQPRVDKVALYISLFPQLIAGPIVRYVDVAEQIDHRRESLSGFASGMQRFVIGLSKKVLIANTLAPLADEAFSMAGTGLHAIGAWLGLVCYALQIYFDFSGYSDMAIGLGRMFGFEFMENFNYPYISGSIREFWNRWHISLSTWFRDYLYIPLGGNRTKSEARHLLNIAIVFLCTGLWHGASWSFLLWGAYHGLFRMIEQFNPQKRWPKPLRIASTLLIVLVGWVLFRAEGMGETAAFFSAMGGFGGERMLTSATPRALLMLGVGIIGCTPFPARAISSWTHVPAEPVKWVVVVSLLLLSMASLASASYNPFIYFRF